MKITIPFSIFITLSIHQANLPVDILSENRTAVVDGELVFIPKKLPKFTRKQKYEMLLKEGVDPYKRNAGRLLKSRRSLADKPWRIQAASHDLSSAKPLPRLLGGPTLPKIEAERPLVHAAPHLCPPHFDAITEGHNHRTYIFAADLVYEIWRADGLQQRAAYQITDLFPSGPRRVSAAMTNLRSGVTVLFSHRQVYRFKWNRKQKRFQLARNSPQTLTNKVHFVPRLAFQWHDGNIVISEGETFVTYDPYWNLATFSGKVIDYFPNVPRDAIGLAHNGKSTFLLLTGHNGLQIYDMKKFKTVQEYPISVNGYVACLVEFKPGHVEQHKKRT